MPLKEDDPRVEFVVTHAMTSFGSERAKFMKSFANEDNLTRLPCGARGRLHRIPLCAGTRRSRILLRRREPGLYRA